MNFFGVFTNWTFDPAMAIVVIVCVATYAYGLMKIESAHPWPLLRTIAYGAGVISLIFSTWAGLGAKAHELFWAYTVQINILLMIAPVLLVLGRPYELFKQHPPTFLSQGWRGVLLHPAVAPLLIPAVLGAVFFTPILQATLTNYALYELLHLVLLALGVVFALAFTTERARETTSLVILAMAAAFIEFLIDGVPGFVLRISNEVMIPSHYLHLPPHAGPSPLNDQHLGGAIMWGLADSIDAPFIALLLLRWIRADTREGDEAFAAEVVDEVFEQNDSDGIWWETELNTYASRRAAALRRQALAQRRPPS
jgi:putative membrane protein